MWYGEEDGFSPGSGTYGCMTLDNLGVLHKSQFSVKLTLHRVFMPTWSANIGKYLAFGKHLLNMSHFSYHYHMLEARGPVGPGLRHGKAL